jgi:hypothetical protein
VVTLALAVRGGVPLDDYVYGKRKSYDSVSGKRAFPEKGCRMKVKKSKGDEHRNKEIKPGWRRA